VRSRPSEPLSPELILVAPAEEAQHAREELGQDDVRARPEHTVSDDEVAVESWEHPRGRSRRRLTSVFGGVAVLIAVVGGAFWAWHRSHDSAPSRSVTGKAFAPARAFSWPAVSGSRYRVRFWREGRKVLDLRAAKPRLIVPRTFVFAPGRYRWSVLAVSGVGARRLVVNSDFVVAKR